MATLDVRISRQLWIEDRSVVAPTGRWTPPLLKKRCAPRDGADGESGRLSVALSARRRELSIGFSEGRACGGPDRRAPANRLDAREPRRRSSAGRATPPRRRTG